MTDWYDAAERRRLAIICSNIRKGLCGCGRAPLDGKRLCEVCWQRKRERNRDLQRALHLEGICSTCLVRPARPGQWHCQHCADLQRERDQRRPPRPNRERGPDGRYHVARSRGLCGLCRRNPAPEGTVCERCKSARKRRRKGKCGPASKARRENAKRLGLCVRCMSSPAKPGSVQCEPCLEHKRQRRRAAKQDRERRRL